MPNCISQEDTVNISRQTANLIIDDLEELDRLRDAYNINNQLIAALRMENVNLEELLKKEQQTVELLRYSSRVREQRPADTSWIAKAWSGLKKYLIGFALGATTVLLSR